MPSKHLWPGAPGSIVEPPGPVRVTDRRDHPSVTINGTRYSWAPDQSDGVPAEALDIWKRYLEANS